MRAVVLPTAVIFALGACTGPDPLPNNNDKGEITDTASDVAGPDIRHEGSATAWPMGTDYPVSAVITDDSGLLLVTLYYRRQTSASFDTRGMILSSEGFYSGVIPGEDQGSAGMHYYLEAVDTVGNTATLPAGAPNDFFRFNLVEE